MVRRSSTGRSKKVVGVRSSFIRGMDKVFLTGVAEILGAGDGGVGHASS